MTSADIGILLAVVGLGNLVAFAQTSKHQLMGKWSTVLGVLTIPLGVAVLWRLALDFGWWTIAIFIVVSLVVGFMTAALARGNGVASVYLLQPVVGTIALGCTAAALR